MSGSEAISPSRSALGKPNPMSVSSLLNAANTIWPTLSFERPRTDRLVGTRQRQPDRAYVVRARPRSGR